MKIYVLVKFISFILINEIKSERYFLTPHMHLQIIILNNYQPYIIQDVCIFSL